MVYTWGKCKASWQLWQKVDTAEETCIVKKAAIIKRRKPKMSALSQDVLFRPPYSQLVLHNTINSKDCQLFFALKTILYLVSDPLCSLWIENNKQIR